MKLAIGCDEAAYALKIAIKEHLNKTHPEVVSIAHPHDDLTIVHPSFCLSSKDHRSV